MRTPCSRQARVARGHEGYRGTGPDICVGMTRSHRPRERTPRPWVRHRLPNGRGALEQPNVTGDGPVPLTVGFCAAVLLTGASAGLCGAGLMFVLGTVQRAAFGYHTGYFESAVVHADPARRVAALLIAGALAGPAWYLLCRATSGEHTEVDDAVWSAPPLSGDFGPVSPCSTAGCRARIRPGFGMRMVT